MRQLTIAIVLLMVIALQSALRAIWQPLAYTDLALILVVYFALRREPLNALVVAAIAGTFLLYVYDSYFSERARQQRQFTLRRRVARRPAGLRRTKRAKPVKWS